MLNNTELEIIPGRTLVRVMRKVTSELTGKEVTIKAKEGVVLRQTSAFVSVYSNAPIDKGGDLTPEMAFELFPIMSEKAWIEVVGCKSESNAFPVPPCFR